MGRSGKSRLERSRESRPAPLGADTKSFWLAYGLILLAAVAMRFFNLSRFEFELDEYCSILTAVDPGGILEALSNDTNAPLYFFILRPWVALFGISEAAARSLSALFGVAEIAALGLFLVGFTESRRIALWAMLLSTLAPLHLFHSQVARGYTLLYLLIVLALWSFTVAVRRDRWWFWAVHGLCLLAALYTHNLALPLVGGFWIAAAALRPGRRAAVGLLATHAVVGVLYLPWVGWLLGQTGVSGLEWIEEFWRAIPPPLAIPRSLEVLGIGGLLPSYFRELSDTPGPAVRLFSIACFAALAAVGIFVRPDSNRAALVPGKTARLFLIFVFLPLLFPFLYSIAVRPIYVVGRYDTLAQPAYLALVASGLAGLQTLIPRLSGRGGGFALGAIILALAVASLAPRFGPLSAPRDSLWLNRTRAEILRDHAGGSDRIVCFGLDGAAMAYEKLRTGFAPPVATYPASTLDHPGWINARELFEERPDDLIRDARLLFDRMADSATPPGRLWIVVDPVTASSEVSLEGRNYLASIGEIFRDEAAAAGARIVSPPEPIRDRCRALGLNLMAFEPQSEAR